MDETEAWAVLGLSPGSSEEQIGSAFREKARFVHPDQHPGKDEAPYTELMQRLTDARDVVLASTTRPPAGSDSPPAASRSRWRELGRMVGFARSRD